MKLIDNLISKLAPHECVGCGQEGSLLCHACGDILSDPTISPAPGHLDTIRSVTMYEEFARDLVWQFKFRGARAAADTMALHMTSLILSDSTPDTVIVPVPTANSRVRQRGFDQAKLLARELSRRSGLRYVDCLRRLGQTHQVGASRKQRLAQLNGALEPKRCWFPQCKGVILIDDVATTGATLETAAAVVRQITDADRIDGVVFARAE